MYVCVYVCMLAYIYVYMYVWTHRVGWYSDVGLDLYSEGDRLEFRGIARVSVGPFRQLRG
jgi:hypothetical protein